MTKESVTFWMSILSFGGIVLIGTFGAGFRLNRETQDAVAALRQTIETTYVRADVYASDQRRLSEAIDRLTAALEPQESKRALPAFGRDK